VEEKVRRKWGSARISEEKAKPREAVRVRLGRTTWRSADAGDVAKT
jgi:hypothetical protein